MDSHGLNMVGKFYIEQVDTLPVWTPNDERRLIYNLDDNIYYVGNNTEWIKFGGNVTGLPGLLADDQHVLDAEVLAAAGVNSGITSMTGLDDDGIPHAKIANLQGNRNAIINGDFNIWQRGTSFAAIASGAFSADRFVYHTVGTSINTISRDTDVPTQVESGYKSNYSLKLDVTTIDSSIAVDDFVLIRQTLEGFNFAPFMGKNVTLSFWVKAVKTGIYCVYFQNFGADRSYVVEYTINSASTWEKKTITLNFSDSGGVWNYINGVGLHVSWVLAAGTTYQTTADTWQTGDYKATSNQVNGVDNTDNNFWLAQVQLELGDTATDFDHRPIVEELALCQRYYEKSYAYGTYAGATTEAGSIVELSLRNNGDNSVGFFFLVWKRIIPTITLYSTNSGDSDKIYCGSDYTAIPKNRGNGSVTHINCAGAPTNQHAKYHWTADAEL